MASMARSLAGFQSLDYRRIKGEARAWVRCCSAAKRTVWREPTIFCGACRKGLVPICARLCGKRVAKSRAKNGVEARHERSFAMSKRTFKYRLYPNRRQREKLQATLDVCRELYNAALQERREAWSSHRKSIHYVEQANQLPDIKAVREDVRAVHSKVLQDALRRIDKTFQAFFLRCKRGQVPGFPRFRSESRYDSFTYPQTGFQLGGRLSLSKI
ncbi:MAG TPA: transposase, partial [Candidatus Acidoferrum sp.]